MPFYLIEALPILIRQLYFSSIMAYQAAFFVSSNRFFICSISRFTSLDLSVLIKQNFLKSTSPSPSQSIMLYTLLKSSRVRDIPQNSQPATNSWKERELSKFTSKCLNAYLQSLNFYSSRIWIYLSNYCTFVDSSSASGFS